MVLLNVQLYKVVRYYILTRGWGPILDRSGITNISASWVCVNPLTTSRGRPRHNHHKKAADQFDIWKQFRDVATQHDLLKYQIWHK